MSKARILKKIICPNCGAEYLPCEIFYPRYIFGEYKYIPKDANGKILGDDSLFVANNSENYKCDYCNTTFTAFVNMTFSTNIISAVDFSHDYETVINTADVTLDEE